MRLAVPELLVVIAMFAVKTVAIVVIVAGVVLLFRRGKRDSNRHRPTKPAQP